MTIDYEAIDGLLLGDASIHPRGNFFSFAQAGEERLDFVLMVKDILEGSGFESRLNNGVRHSDGVYVSTMWTLSSQFWADYRKKFYPRGKKIVPSSFRATPRNILMLYLSDGSLGWAHGGPWEVGASSWVEIAICSFPPKDIEKVGDEIARRSLIFRYAIKRNGCLAVRGGNKSTERFFRFISKGGVVPPSMVYKFKGYENYMEVL